MPWPCAFVSLVRLVNQLLALGGIRDVPGLHTQAGVLGQILGSAWVE